MDWSEAQLTIKTGIFWKIFVHKLQYFFRQWGNHNNGVEGSKPWKGYTVIYGWPKTLKARKTKMNSHFWALRFFPITLRFNISMVYSLHKVELSKIEFLFICIWLHWPRWYHHVALNFKSWHLNFNLQPVMKMKAQ